MEENKIYIRERFTRSGRLQGRTAVLPEECGFGGKRTVLVVSGNEFDDFSPPSSRSFPPVTTRGARHTGTAAMCSSL